MNEYNKFAIVYDELMNNVDYEKWSAFVSQKASKRGRKILELGCGTGTMAMQLDDMGFVVTATDISEEMLAVAHEKSMEAGNRVRFLTQDMSRINIKDRFDTVISFCDGLNYITDEASLGSVFRGVYGVLGEDGVLIVEMSTEHKLKSVLGDSTIAENSDEVSFIWENQFNEKDSLLEFNLSLFIKCESDDDGDGELFERHVEHHTQRAWKKDEISAASGKYFDIEEVLDGETLESLEDESERMIMVFRKKI